MSVSLYSNKQKWKIILLVFAILLVGLSLLASNNIVGKVSDREKDRATQWADAIRKKVELVQLTNNTFSQLRDKEREKMQLWIEATKEVSKPSSLNVNSDVTFPFQIINQNKNIPVILVGNDDQISGHINLDFDIDDLEDDYPNSSEKELQKAFDDSLLALTREWRKLNDPFTIEVYEGLFMTYYYSDSKAIVRLEEERDSLFQAFNKELIDNEGLVPVLLLTEDGDSVVGSNLGPEEIQKEKIPALKKRLAKSNDPFPIEFGDREALVLYYDSSPELRQLQYFPYIQFFIIGLFAIIGYLIFSTFRKAEQNQVWAGMAKETAHQLGTPLSSLMAWTELLDAEPKNQAYTMEMRKDIERLDKVTDRFSKIGSEAKLLDTDISGTVERVVKYLRPRISSKVELVYEPVEMIESPHNGPLLEWVIENVVKNAVDAMEANGKVQVTIKRVPENVIIDIEDNGKGLPAKLQKRIFEPGFSTKKRGWGLGLSLVKRIVSDYHKGKIFVLSSEVGKGTTFRITLPA